MTIIHDVRLELDKEQVLRREGIRHYSSTRAEIKTLIDELLTSTKVDKLTEPAIAYEIYPITNIKHHQLTLANNTRLHSLLLASVLSGAEELATVVGTIGPRLEKRVSDYLDNNEPLKGLLLDGIGNAAVDSLTQEVCKIIMDIALSHGHQASSPFSPGMPGFPITEQWPLFQMVPAQQIGVSLTNMGVMVPLKSTSMVIGIGQKVTTWSQAEFCTHCQLSSTCRYRPIDDPVAISGL